MQHTIALVGNPNCGKTTLFNSLTGSNQYVGNWAGVTVEKKEGKMTWGECEMNIVDLPGIYSLSPYTMEEIVTRDYIIDYHPNAILNIIDGTNIERNLYLSLQLMELGRPMVIAVNMMDDVIAKGDSINCKELSNMLGVPVVPITARKGENLDELMDVVEHIAHYSDTPNAPGADEEKIPYHHHHENFTSHIVYDNTTRNALNGIIQILLEDGADVDLHVNFYAGKLLEGDESIPSKLNISSGAMEKIEKIITAYEATRPHGHRDWMLADARYRYITAVVKSCVKKNMEPGAMTTSDKIDRIVTHRVFALPVFLLIMLAMFVLTFGPVGNTMKGWFEAAVDFLGGAVGSFLTAYNAPAWTHSLLVDAVIGGVGSVVSFMPQIMLLFLCLSILEDSGYMARAAFIMDRLLRKLGLTGKSFIPMLMGFGCTTPAVMAARTMENMKDRRLTIMLTPFMSCGAKLPIYGMFASIFFPNYQGLVVFSMYLIGMVVAVLCGLLLKNTLFKGDAAPFVMELPTYRLPTLKSTLLHMWEKCKGFLVKAGTIIFSMSIVVWLLQNFTPTLHMTTDSTQSIFAAIGILIAPLFTPLGFGQWQAAVALLTGLIAKETVVSTMQVLYSSAELPISVALAQVFTPLSAFSFMVFCLLYVPCIAAFVSIRREMGSTKWAVGAAVFQTGVAYVISLLIYQIGSLFV